MGWARLQNGDLLDAAEGSFDVLDTTDQNLRHEQNLAGRSLAIVVLTTTSWPRIRAHLPDVVAAVESVKPGEYREVSVPK